MHIHSLTAPYSHIQFVLLVLVLQLNFFYFSVQNVFFLTFFSLRWNTHDQNDSRFQVISQKSKKKIENQKNYLKRKCFVYLFTKLNVERVLVKLVFNTTKEKKNIFSNYKWRSVRTHAQILLIYSFEIVVAVFLYFAIFFFLVSYFSGLMCVCLCNGRKHVNDCECRLSNI